MPGNPFKKPFKGGKVRASVRAPSSPKAVSHVPRPASPNGLTSRRVGIPSQPRVRVTTKARKSVSPPSVRQGAQLGTPGRHG